MATSSHQSLNKHTRLTLKLTLQFIDTRHQSLLSRIVLRRWVKIALSKHAEITLRFVDVIEGQALNYNYRGRITPLMC